MERIGRLLGRPGGGACDELPGGAATELSVRRQRTAARVKWRRRKHRTLPPIPIITAQGLSKRFGATPLFKNIPFTISEGDRIGLIGPNGSGKSTLIKILQGTMEPDSGEVARRKGVRLSCVEQVPTFAEDETVRSVIENVFHSAAVPENERQKRFAETMGRAGFSDFEARAMDLSGGWRKRLAIATAMIEHPDILLLDEPTNHLDLEGIKWLENILQNAAFACVVVSHDRYFLENVANEMVELDRAYPDGFLRVDGNYSKFLEAKKEFLHAQRKQQEALANRVHTEIEWLRRGPKARTTKSKARIDKAHELIGKLADMNERSRVSAAGIDFSASGGRPNSWSAGWCGVFSVTAKFSRIFDSCFRRKCAWGSWVRTEAGRPRCCGCCGATWNRRRARFAKRTDCESSIRPEARTGWTLTLGRALAPDSDAVVYQGRVMHVGAWTREFFLPASS